MMPCLTTIFKRVVEESSSNVLSGTTGYTMTDEAEPMYTNQHSPC
jgi:hypothetical protein